MNVPRSCSIEDPRVNFKIKTYNEYKKTSVFTSLLKSIGESRLEEACHWTAELVASGYVIELFDKLLIYSSKNINIKNSKILTNITSKKNIKKKLIYI